MLFGPRGNSGVVLGDDTDNMGGAFAVDNGLVIPADDNYDIANETGNSEPVRAQSSQL